VLRSQSQSHPTPTFWAKPGAGAAFLQLIEDMAGAGAALMKYQ